MELPSVRLSRVVIPLENEWEMMIWPKWSGPRLNVGDSQHLAYQVNLLFNLSLQSLLDLTLR